jgi:hypothetical protein
MCLDIEKMPSEEGNHIGIEAGVESNAIEIRRINATLSMAFRDREPGLN